VWGKEIHIGGLVIRRGKALHLDKAFLHQFFETVVELAQADVHFPGHLPLGEVGVGVQYFEEAVGNFRVHSINIRLRYKSVRVMLADACSKTELLTILAG